MIGYGGIGNSKNVRLIGRALMAPTFFEEKYEIWARRRGLPTLEDMRLRAAERAPSGMGDLIRDAVGADSDDDSVTTATARGERGWRQFIDAEIPFQPVLVQIGSKKQVIYTDRGGYIDTTIEGHDLTPGWHTATIQALKADEVARGLKRVHASRPVFVPVRIVAREETHGLVSERVLHLRVVASSCARNEFVPKRHCTQIRGKRRYEHVEHKVHCGNYLPVHGRMERGAQFEALPNSRGLPHGHSPNDRLGPVADRLVPFRPRT